MHRHCTHSDVGAFGTATSRAACLPSLMQMSGRKQAWNCNDILNIDHALLQRENAQATDTKTDETERMVQENICLEEITWDRAE